MTFQQEHWFLKDLKYEYLPDGFKLTATTDVPCHLWARMTTTPPRKHALPSYRRGLFIQGDIRFCFVVYEDNEQDEAGDTLIHTWIKDAWPACETRWFYFVGTINAVPVVSESPIFKFHFPDFPPPLPFTQMCHADPLGVTATSTSARYRFGQVFKPINDFTLTHLIISLGRDPGAGNYPPAEGFVAVHYVDVSNLPIDPPKFQVDFTIAVPDLGPWYPFKIIVPHTDLHSTIKYAWIIGSNYSLDPACRYLIERGTPGPCDTINPWWYSYSRWAPSTWSPWTRGAQHQYRYQMFKFT